MVEEQRTQIGILKALGYGKGTIAAKYMIYAGTASVAGSLVGLAVGFWIFPTVIWQAYSILYNLPAIILSFNVKFALISSLAAVLMYIACNVVGVLQRAGVCTCRSDKA